MSQDLLTVSAYNEAERVGRDQLPNRAIQASSTESFNRVGFPHSCSDEGGIWRFVETMHEGSHNWVWRKYLDGLTDDEAEALKDLNFNILPALDTKFHRPVQAGNSLLCSLALARQVNAMFSGKQLRILEIGAGSGYLSWLLARAGHRVITTDVAQGFYLFQNHLLRQSLGGAMVELATDDRSIAECLDDDAIRSIHLPWWKYYDLYRSEPDWSVDVVLSEGNLCEMSSFGHKYAINLSKKFLDQHNDFSFLGFIGWGYQENVRHFEVFDAFCDAGFAMRHTDDRLTVMAPCKERQEISRNLRIMAKHYQQTQPDWREMLMLPRSFASPTTEWTQLIQMARTAIQADLTLSAEDVMADNGSKFGLSLPGGEDQLFAQFIGQC